MIEAALGIYVPLLCLLARGIIYPFAFVGLTLKLAGEKLLNKSIAAIDWLDDRMAL